MDAERWRGESRRRFVVVALIVLATIVAAHLSDIRLGALFDSEGTASASAMLEGLLDPDLDRAFVARIAKLALESLCIGLLGTVMAAVIGVGLSLVAIRVPRLPHPVHTSRVVTWGGGLVRLTARFVLGVFRSVPDIVWAYMFVRVLGLGPGPAVLAIGLATGGVMGKLFTELAEAVDPVPIHALRRYGVGRMGILLFGVLPQVRKHWIAYALFRLECSIRTASILGVVGAGGLGSEIALSVRYFEYDKLATALLAVLAYVVAFELLSSFLRRRPLRWTLLGAAAGSLASLAYLDIPWSDLFDGGLIPDHVTFGSDASAFLLVALRLTVETVAMAWCATIGAAVLAFLLAPLASATLTVGRYRVDAPGGGGAGRIVRWALFLLTRLVFQVCRAMPELTLAFVFVVWVGPGPFAGVLAVSLHTVGVLGRLFTDTYEEVERGPAAALESTGATRVGVWLYGVVPQVLPRILALSLYRFEVNLRATAMVGFIGAGGVGNAIHTAISLFHFGDLVLLLGVILAVVTALDWLGDLVRFRVLGARFGTRDQDLRRRGLADAMGTERPPLVVDSSHPGDASRRPVFYRRRFDRALEPAYTSSVSAGEMFIHTDAPHPKGLILEIFVAPPGARPQVELESAIGRVSSTRTDPDRGMVVQLLEPSERFLSQLGVGGG